MFNKSKIALWVENYLFHPNSLFEKLLSYSLLPFSALYCLIVLYKRNQAPKKMFISKIPIISIGNLTVGGNGKTPLCITLAKEYDDVAIVLRGYGRGSQGLVLVSQKGQVLCDARASGDEAMLFAKSLPKATVIVCEDRIEAIHYAKKLACRLVFLDDGFSKSNIKKFDILIKPNPEPKNHFCLPSGPYREPRSLYSKANLVVEEGIDFDRYVTIKNPTEKMLLVTAISKPSRLDKYLPPNVIAKVTFRDHYVYNENELQELLLKHHATSILTTQKDAVKMTNFHIPLSILELEVKVSPAIKEQINTFLAQKR